MLTQSNTTHFCARVLWLAVSCLLLSACTSVGRQDSSAPKNAIQFLGVPALSPLGVAQGRLEMHTDVSKVILLSNSCTSSCNGRATLYSTIRSDKTEIPVKLIQGEVEVARFVATKPAKAIDHWGIEVHVHEGPRVIAIEVKDFESKSTLFSASRFFSSNG